LKILSQAWDIFKKYLKFLNLIYYYGKNFSILKTIKNALIIICKGIEKNHRFEKCTFICDGNWEDKELVEHQKYHESLEGENYSWLGFDASQSFGNFSGRDGKRT